MKKLLIITGILLLMAGSLVMAQEIDPNRLDLSQVKVSIAGPDEIYLRSIYYEGRELSVKFKYDGARGAVVYGPYYAEDKYFPDSVDLDYVTIEVVGKDTLRISNVRISDELAYGGIIHWVGGPDLELVSYWEDVPPKTKDERIDELNGEIYVLNEKLREQTKQIAVLNERVSEQSDQIKVLKEDHAFEVASLNRELRELRARAAGAGIEVPVLPERVIYSGFRGGDSLLGNWKVTENNARQVDAAQMYAKYSLPLAQKETEMLFGFTGRATDIDRIGYGLHFFASGEKTGSGYGFGSSYLVWLTKDKIFYKSESTYVQLYRSFDDVRMIQIASVSIPERIDSSLNTEVLYNSSDGTISVYVNGVKRIDYRVQSPLVRGDSIILRSLGATTEFTDLYVKVH